MSALRNMALVLLPLSLACAGIGCAAQTADDDVAEEQAQSADVAANGGEDVGETTEACGGFGGWGGGWGGGWHGGCGFHSGCGFPGYGGGCGGYGGYGGYGGCGGYGGYGRFGGCW